MLRCRWIDGCSIVSMLEWMDSLVRVVWMFKSVCIIKYVGCFDSKRILAWKYVDSVVVDHISMTLTMDCWWE
jgi:hypothetical protein